MRSAENTAGRGFSLKLQPTLWMLFVSFNNILTAHTDTHTHTVNSPALWPAPRWGYTGSGPLHYRWFYPSDSTLCCFYSSCSLRQTDTRTVGGFRDKFTNRKSLQREHSPANQTCDRTEKRRSQKASGNEESLVRKTSETFRVCMCECVCDFFLGSSDCLNENPRHWLNDSAVTS